MDKGLEKALDALLKVYEKEDAKKEIVKAIEIGYVQVRQPRKTLYKFSGLGTFLRHIVFSDIYYVEMDLKNYNRLHDYISKCNSSRYDMFDFDRGEDCIVAMD